MIRWQIEQIEAVSPKLRGELRELWLEEPFSSPFVAPQFLEVITQRVLCEAGKVLFVKGLSEKGRMVAFWPLMVEPSGKLQFLQSGHTDHCCGLCLPEVEPQELGQGLADTLDQVKPSSVFLRNVPSLGPALQAANEGLSRAGWAARAFPSYSSPQLSVAAGPDAAERLRAEINRHTRLKNYESRLRQEPGYAFEVFEDAEQMDDWITDYCDIHEWRWDRTETPSKFRFAGERKFFAEVLKAWNRDGVLIRFSIRLARGRIACVGALTCRNRLICHHAVTAAGYQQAGADRVLIRSIGLWMCDKGFNVLDFGTGPDAYKFGYANSNEKLWHVYGARKAISVAFARGWLEQRVRKSDKLQRLRDEWLNRHIRGKLCRFLRNIRKRILFTKRRYMGMPVRSFLGILRSRFLRRREIVYRAYGISGPKDPQVAELKTFDVLEMLEETDGLFESWRACYMEYRHNGARAFGIIEDGRVLHVSWLEKAAPESFPRWLKDNTGAIWTVGKSVTAKPARGRGLYPQALKAILRIVPAGDTVIISADRWNSASQRGIEKAGFVPVAVRVARPADSIGRFERLSATR